MNRLRRSRLCGCVAVAFFCLSIPVLGQDPYIKAPVGEPDGTPPPDANKPCFGCDGSCWLATAANMLAGAGYGTGATVQARADDIYGDLKVRFTAAG